MARRAKQPDTPLSSRQHSPPSAVRILKRRNEGFDGARITQLAQRRYCTSSHRQILIPECRNQGDNRPTVNQLAQCICGLASDFPISVLKRRNKWFGGPAVAQFAQYLRGLSGQILVPENRNQGLGVA